MGIQPIPLRACLLVGSHKACHLQCLSTRAPLPCCRVLEAMDRLEMPATQAVAPSLPGLFDQGLEEAGSLTTNGVGGNDLQRVSAL